FPGSPGDRITINDYFGSAGGVEQIEFADGTAWTVDAVRAVLIAKAQTTGDDIVYGFGTDDVLNGGAGNDTLIGGGGMDTYVYA
ncbi:calcium-binding protein, partial [Klebsiella pneumoniae]|uniref:calcium-binding protein n=1 Tax=Klebsiella pneumoniae TaxID=573 RepID=UPI0023B85F85